VLAIAIGYAPLTWGAQLAPFRRYKVPPYTAPIQMFTGAPTRPVAGCMVAVT